MTGVASLLSAADTDFLMFTTTVCPYCNRAKAMLDSKGFSYQEHSVSSDRSLMTEVVELTGHRTVPAIWDLRGEEPRFIGGSDDLAELL